jgi:hypothetical protein
MVGKNQKMRMLLIMGLIALGLVWAVGCKKSSSEVQSIIVDLQQSQWTSNANGGSGIIEVFLQGDGVEKIILDSIAMKGDKPGVSPLKASSAVLQDKRIRAEFSKSDALNLLLNPSHGSTHHITVIYMLVDSADSAELDMQVTLDDGNPISLTLELAPAEWDLNFVNSSGKVETFIRGTGIEKIDLTTIRMKGDNTAVEPMVPESVSLNGDHIRAAYPKNLVLNLLLNPTEGSVHTVVVSFLEVGGTVPIELTAQITVTDEDGDDGEEPTGPLTLQISPSDWNLNYYKNSGTVSAFIRGEGIEKIVLTSILLKGDNTAALPLAAATATLNGDHVRATFPKNQVLGLLLNPVSGSVHTVTVSFQNDAGLVELTAEVTVVGKSE